MPKNYDGIEAQARTKTHGTPYRDEARRIEERRAEAARREAEAAAKAEAAETLH